MNPPGLPTALLAVTLALRAVSPVGAAAAALLLGSVAGAAWTSGARRAEAAQFRAALPQAAPAAPQAASAQTRIADNLADFYGSLGDIRYSEQQVRTLFGLAGKAGLVLNQGEYRSAYDRQGRFHTYRVTLPVKGGYGAVWRFAMLALSSIPFASLDEISFRRASAGEAGVEARLQLTIYLADGEAG